MFRIKDPKASLDFYSRVLGMSWVFFSSIYCFKLIIVEWNWGSYTFFGFGSDSSAENLEIISVHFGL